MSKAKNSRKERFLKSFAQSSLEDVFFEISNRCKFNFSYFDANQEYATDIEKLDEKSLQGFFSKLKLYSKHPLSYWQQQCIGSHKNHVLEIYGAFPKNSGFKYPKHVPSDVDWARFRLDGKKRLVGFTIPKDFCIGDATLNDSTFYIVFLDLSHKFYLKNK
ncbi:MAG: hypothetical protein WDA17_04760 [Sphaerochaetaceae bacterium]